MSARVLATLLALLLWSGVAAAHVDPWAVDAARHVQQQFGATVCMAPGGSVDEGMAGSAAEDAVAASVDAQSEGQADLPMHPQAGLHALPGSVASSRLRPAAMASWTSSIVEAPQRPPCSPGLHA